MIKNIKKNIIIIIIETEFLEMMKNIDIISSLKQENEETQEEKVNKNISNK
jgi:hypothetical protein